MFMQIGKKKEKEIIKKKNQGPRILPAESSGVSKYSEKQ